MPREFLKIFDFSERFAILVGNSTSWILALISAESFAFVAAGFASLTTAFFMIAKFRWASIDRKEAKKYDREYDI